MPSYRFRHITKIVQLRVSRYANPLSFGFLGSANFKSTMAESIRTHTPGPSSSRFPGLLIANVTFTDTKLGRGADAAVYAVEWNGTVCAAKRLHEVLLEDESPGGVSKMIGNFEAECLTWSKLRHPGVVQFLGVYLERSSRLPVLIMERMDTSLRTHLEDHSKEEFSLHQKAFVLRQVTQALAYLHNQNPPLVHHDLSPNNVLLNVVSFATKVSDFGMSRAINPSALGLTRKSSIKGTQAFMAPEALHDPPRYNEKLDVFSFGNVILATVTHEWPNPSPPNRYEGDQLVALNELQRREQFVVMFTVEEKQLFLPSVNQYLENRPDKRPSSVMLVRELRRIESSFPRGSLVTAPIEQLRQQLSTKEEECRQKDEALREKDDALREKNAVIREKNTIIQAQQAVTQRLRNELAVAQKVKHPLRDWRKLGECQKVIQLSPEGGWYGAVAVYNEGLIAVTDGSECVDLLTSSGVFLTSIGGGVFGGGWLFGVAFDPKGNVWVTDWGYNKVVKLSQDGRLLQTIHHAGSESDGFRHPFGVSISPEGLIYICDHDNHRVTVHDEEGQFLFAFGSKGSGPGCFEGPYDVAFDSGGLLYVSDGKNRRVSVWSEEGTFMRDFKTKYEPTYIAASSDNHLLIKPSSSHIVMVYTMEGELVHEFVGYVSCMGSLRNQPIHQSLNFGLEGSHSRKSAAVGHVGICVDGNGLVYVVVENRRVGVF